MLGAERDGEGNLREVSVEFVAVEFVAVAQQHAEQMDGNIQNKRTATCRTKGWQHAEQQKDGIMQNNKKSAAVFPCGAFINRYCTCD